MSQPHADPITQGTLRTSSGRTLPLERTDVKARIAGPVASVEVVQRFRNDTGEPIEATYLFPLPHDASVHTMRFRIGERVVEATVEERAQASRAYEAARDAGRTATLLEQDDPSLFTLSVANIVPGETIEVTLGYHEKLAYDGGEQRFVFPLVATPRYHEDLPVDASAPWGAHPRRPASTERAADVGVEVEIHTFVMGTTIQKIDAFLAGISARGSTQLSEALHGAAKLPVREGRARLVVLITDAALDNEGYLIRRAPEILGEETRLYVLGVGPSVNRYLVERLARAAGGASDVLLPTEDVETVVPRFARRIHQGGPALSRIELACSTCSSSSTRPAPRALASAR